MKTFLKAMISSMGYEVRRNPETLPGVAALLAGSAYPQNGIPDAQSYQPVFSPWLCHGEFAAYHDKRCFLSLWKVRTYEKKKANGTGTAGLFSADHFA